MGEIGAMSRCRGHDIIQLVDEKIPLKLDLIVFTTLTDRKLQQEPLERSGAASYRLQWVRLTRRLTVTERQQ